MVVKKRVGRSVRLRLMRALCGDDAAKGWVIGRGELWWWMGWESWVDHRVERRRSA